MDTSLDQLFEQIHREGANERRERQRTAFDRIAGPYRDALVLFGAGPLGKTVLGGLRRAGLEPLAFADNNSLLWGKQVEGVTVKAPEEAVKQYVNRACFVVTVFNGSAVRQQLRNLGCAHIAPIAPLYWKYPEIFIPDNGIDLPESIAAAEEQVRAAYALLADERSRKEFCAQIAWRYWLDYDALPAADDPAHIYFPDCVTPLEKEVFVDCGAFDGDSLRSFLNHRGAAFQHLFAMEPDANNIAKLRTFIGRLPETVQQRTTILPYAAAARNAEMKFEATATAGSRIVSRHGTSVVQGRCLDGLEWGHTPTYIKMDIEGAEVDALNGAAALLKQHLPVLAVCVYHRSEHMWQIPALIYSIASGYQLFLRRYAEECWEMVCYAVPHARLEGGQR